MKYLLVKEKGNTFKLYSPETYGMDSWGDMFHQTSLKKKKKHWYIESWSAGNEWIEDDISTFKLNVVLETSDLDEILRYVINATNYNQASIEAILVEAQEIYNDYIDFTAWCLKNNK